MEQQIQSLIDANVKQKVTATSVILRRDGTYRDLVSSGGKATRAGKICERLTGESLETTGLDLRQTPVRKNNMEYIRFSGKKRLIRRFDPATKKISKKRTDQKSKHKLADSEKGPTQADRSKIPTKIGGQILKCLLKSLSRRDL